MASRKDQKEQARATRLANEQADAAKAAKTRRFQIFGGVSAIAVIAIAVVVVLVASNSGGPASSVHTVTSQKNVPAPLKTIDAAVNQELAGIPQNGTTLGDPNAKVTMTYFGDLQCPICADFTKGVGDGALPEFISTHVKTGQAKIIYKSFCTATCGNFSNGASLFATQQTAAYAAGKQNKFWNFAETFYREQGTEGSAYMTEGFLRGIAAQIPKLDEVTWQSDRSDKALSAQVSAEEQLAAKIGLGGTPSVILKGPKGETLVGGTQGAYPTTSLVEAAYKEVA